MWRNDPAPRYRTIQKAVDAAKPGDLVLVGPGVYREEVKVRTPSLVIWAIRAFRAAATGRGGAGRGAGEETTAQPFTAPPGRGTRA